LRTILDLIDQLISNRPPLLAVKFNRLPAAKRLHYSRRVHMSVIRELQNGKNKRFSNKFGGHRGGDYVEVYGKEKRTQNFLQDELRCELLELGESAVCVTDKSTNSRAIEKERTAVEKIIAKLALEPGEYTAEVDAVGDVHIRLGANITSFSTTLIVRNGQIVCAFSDEFEEPEDPFLAYYERLRHNDEFDREYAY
jgi:hypothetical protein